MRLRLAEAVVCLSSLAKPSVRSRSFMQSLGMILLSSSVDTRSSSNVRFKSKCIHGSWSNSRSSASRCKGKRTRWYPDTLKFELRTSKIATAVFVPGWMPSSRSRPRSSYTAPHVLVPKERTRWVPSITSQAWFPLSLRTSIIDHERYEISMNW